MDPSLTLEPCRLGNINAFRHQAGVKGSTVKHGATGIKGRLDIVFQLIDGLPKGPPRVWFKTAKGFHQPGDIAFFTNRRNTHRIQLPRIGGSNDGGQCPFADFVDGVHSIPSRFCLLFDAKAGPFKSGPVSSSYQRDVCPDNPR
jgi:hypothetical protein